MSAERSVVSQEGTLLSVSSCVMFLKGTARLFCLSFKVFVFFCFFFIDWLFLSVCSVLFIVRGWISALVRYIFLCASSYLPPNWTQQCVCVCVCVSVPDSTVVCVSVLITMQQISCVCVCVCVCVTVQGGLEGLLCLDNVPGRLSCVCVWRR